MPDRVVRDELLESERWLALPSDTERLAFVALLLKADALGNFSAELWRLWRLWRDFAVKTEDAAAKTLERLAEADLVRLYEVDAKRYVHIPRFSQRLRYVKRVFPPSPWTSEAEKQILMKNSPGDSPARTGSAPLEVKGSEVKKTLSSAAPTLPQGFLAFWAAYPSKNRRVDKARCVALWHHDKLEGVAETIVEHVKAMAVSNSDWQRGYEPAPLRYLKGHRWQDELPSKSKTRLAL